MSELRVRSRNGCLTCKNRRKKCDETRPACYRCRRAGIECLGYSHLDNPTPKPRKPRNEVSTRAPSQSSPGSFNQAPNSSPKNMITEIPSVHLPSSLTQPDSMRINEAWLLSGSLAKTYMNLDHLNTFDGSLDKLFDSDQPETTEAGMQDVSSLWWGTSFSSPGSTSPYMKIHSSDETALLSGTSQLLDILPIDSYSFDASNGPVHNYLEPIDRDYSATELILNSALVSPPFSGLQNPIWPFSNSEKLRRTPESDDESDIEDVVSVFGPTLTLDRTASNNRLPFILSSYRRWLTKSVFEPLKIAQRTKDHITERYMFSDDSRCGTILVAAIMDSLDKSPTIVPGSFPEMRALENRVTERLSLIKFSQEPLPDEHGRDVLAALHDIHELIFVQCLISPLSQVIKLANEAAPVYRKACPEPHGALIQLPAKLAHPEPVIRHFPSLDILLSFNTGRPMHFRYDTSYIPGLYERILDVNFIGLQWMNGVPDQFLIMLARMNMLLVDFAPNVDPQIIQELESSINDFKPVLEDSPDSYLKVARLMVYESWRQVMYIYLYMGLCGFASNDTRVEKALKKFVRLLGGVKPGRMPDIFLVTPMCAAGVAAHKQRDRDAIRDRILCIRECARVGTSGNDVAQTLNEIWTMCNAQGRHAVWADLRVATSKVTGII